MYDVSLKLISKTLITSEIGVETETETPIEVPIIRNESIYEREFYAASQTGFKPVMRFRISTLNYNNENELEYMGNRYSIIRAEDKIDETILICERKIGECKESSQSNYPQPLPSI